MFRLGSLLGINIVIFEPLRYILSLFNLVNILEPPFSNNPTPNKEITFIIN